MLREERKGGEKEKRNKVEWIEVRTELEGRLESE